MIGDLNTAPELVSVLDETVPSSHVLLERLRCYRDQLLAATDWTQLPDAACNQDAWALYRAELRDLPSTVKDLTSVKWPEPPK